MKKFVYILLFVGIWFVCSSCRTKTVYIPAKKEIKYVESLKTDTVFVSLEKEVKDVIVFGDSSVLQTKYATSTAIIDSLGRLHHILKNKPVTLPVEVRIKEIRFDSIEYVPQIVEAEKKNSTHVVLCVLIAMLGYAAYKVVRLFKRG